MDSSSLADTLSRDTSCGAYVYGLGCGSSHVEDGERACWNNEETAKYKVQGNRNVPIISEKDMLTVQEAASAPCLIVPIGDLQEQLSDPNATSDGKVFEPKEVETCQELCHSAPLDVKKQKALAKSATFPCSVEMDTADLSVGGGTGVSSTALQGQCSSASSNHIYAHSVTLPASSKLISAMKGSRAQNGSFPNLNLHVKWAPEVYDPPSTLMSHTVKKSHHQRPKAKKKDSNKQKHKGKSMRGSNAQRRIASSSTRDMAMPVTKSCLQGQFHVDMRLQASGDRLLQNGHANSSVEVLEYAVSNQDSKCGSSFLREALAKLHISLAEAT